MKNYLFLMLIVGCWLFSTDIFAQKNQPKTPATPATTTIIEKSAITGQENTWVITGRDAVIVRDSSTNYIQIYVKNSGSVLYGNRCAELIAKKKHIEFVVIPADIGYGMSKREIFFSNLEGHWRAFWRNGFFWRKKLNKQIKACKTGTDDFVR